MTTEIDVVNIKVMQREFKIKCPKNKVKELEEAAYYLDGRMSNLCKGEQNINIDRLAIIASLNITHELIAYKNHKYTLTEKIRKLKSKVEKILAIAN
jgi:cell division protein ZapA